MKVVTNQNFINYQIKSNVNNSPVFKASFVSTPAAKEQLKEGLFNLYRDGDPKYFYKNGDRHSTFNKSFDFNVDFNIFYEKLKKSLERKTKKIKGTINLVEGREKRPYIQFITPNNEVYEKSGYPKTNVEILSSEIIKEGEPKINVIIAQLAGLEMKDINYSEAFNKLFKQQIKEYKRKLMATSA